MEKKLWSLFPEPLGVYKLGRDFSNLEINKINELLINKRTNAANSRSKETFVLDLTEFKELKEFCNYALHDFYKSIFEEEQKLKITQSWLNLTTKGQYHHSHCHPNSFFSGVLFIETEESDSIKFTKFGVQDSFYLNTLNRKSFNEFNSTAWSIPAESGTLLMFRSNLVHEVPITVSEKRISLSFNSFPSGTFGTIDELIHLDLL